MCMTIEELEKEVASLREQLKQKEKIDKLKQEKEYLESELNRRPGQCCGVSNCDCSFGMW